MKMTHEVKLKYILGKNGNLHFTLTNIQTLLPIQHSCCSGDRSFNRPIKIIKNKQNLSLENANNTLVLALALEPYVIFCCYQLFSTTYTEQSTLQKGTTTVGKLNNDCKHSTIPHSVSLQSQCNVNSENISRWN